MLTGPPRINGLLLPYPHYAGGGRGQVMWKPEHVYFSGRRGKVPRQTRYRGEYRFGYNALTRADFEKVVSVLRRRSPITLTLTRSPDDDPRLEEVTHECEMAGALPIAGGPDKAGDLYSLEVTLRTLAWREERPGVSDRAIAHVFDLGEGVNLLGGVQKSDGAWTTPLLGYRGQLLRIAGQGQIRAQFINDAGSVLREESGGDLFYVTAPRGTRQLRVEADGDRPMAVVDADQSALLLTADEQDAYEITTLGEGRIDERPRSLTFDGKTYSLPSSLGVNTHPDLLADETGGAGLLRVDAKRLFTPRGAGGLALWLRGDRGIMSDGSEAAAGDAVSVWEDQSGNGNHVSQEGVNRPSRADVRGVRFDGYSSLFGTSLPSITGPITVFARVNTDEDLSRFNTNSRVIAAQGEWPEESWMLRWARNEGGPDQLNLLTTELAGDVSGRGQTLQLTLVGGESSQELYEGGQLIAQGNASFSAAGDHVLGVGYDGNRDRYYKGRIEDLLIYNRALSDAERRKVESYLSD